MRKPTAYLRLVRALLLIVGCTSTAILVGATTFPKATPSTAAPYTVETSEGTFLVFEANRNEILPEGRRAYFVSPNVYFTSIDGLTPDVSVNEYSTFATVKFTLLLVYPRLEEVVAGLRKVVPGADAARVSQMRFADLVAEHAVFENTSLLGGAKGTRGQLAVSNRGISVTLKSRPGHALDAVRFASALRQGSDAPALRGFLDEGDVQLRSAQFTWNDVANSHSVANFDQISKGKAVTAIQVEHLSMEVTRELNAQLYDEFLDGDETPFLAVSRTIAAALFEQANSNWIDVDRLQALLSPYHIDLRQPAFQPDVIKKFALDVKNKADTKIKTHLLNDYEQWLKSSRSLNIDGRTQANVFKIFGGGASYKQGSSGTHDEGVKSHSEIQDEFNHAFDRSFRIEWEGTQIKRLDVRVFEDLNVDAISRRGNVSVEAHRARFNTVPLAIPVDSKHIRVDTSLESLPGKVNQWPN